MRGRFLFLTLAGVLAFSSGPVGAGEPVVPDGGFAASRYETLWTKSPFAVATPEGGSESADYVLVGIAQFDGVSYAGLIEKQNQEHFLLASNKPVRGLTLTSVTRGHDASDTVAVIERDGQPITLKLEPPEANRAGVPPHAMPLPNGPYPQAPGMFRPANTGSPPAVMHRPRTIILPPNPRQSGQPQPR